MSSGGLSERLALSRYGRREFLQILSLSAAGALLPCTKVSEAAEMRRARLEEVLDTYCEM